MRYLLIYMNFSRFISERSGFVEWKLGTPAIMLIAFLLDYIPTLDYNMSSNMGKWTNSISFARLVSVNVWSAKFEKCDVELTDKLR